MSKFIKNGKIKYLYFAVVSILLFESSSQTKELSLDPAKRDSYKSPTLPSSSPSVRPSDLVFFENDLLKDTFRIVSNLPFSGSHQYTCAQLQTMIFERIPYKTQGCSNILFVDLREEPHWMFCADQTASIAGAKADHYKGLTAQEIKRIEDVFVQQNRGACTEKDAVEKLGALYHRVAITGETRPEDSDVDNIINLVRAIKGENYWLHFHCLAGHGRTTTFMAMYEMLQRKEASLEDILENQGAIGGANLGKTRHWPPYQNRLKFLKNFYAYVHDESEQGYAGGSSWADWVKNKSPEATFQEHPSMESRWRLGSLLSSARFVGMITMMKFSQLTRRLSKR